jgi:hypothetical protein
MDFHRKAKVRSDNPAEGFVGSVQRSGQFTAERQLGSHQELAPILQALNEMSERMRNGRKIRRLRHRPRRVPAARLGGAREA